MLTLLGFGMVSNFMYLIMRKRLSALLALIVVPILFALAGGFAPDVGDMMLEGIRKLAPTGVMLMFAILYFGIMIDAGLFDPVVHAILRVVKGDPFKVLVGTALLTLFVGLDGDGSTTYMIAISAFLPLYRRLGLNTLMLACIVMLSSGVMNLTPWGGPTARAASALHVDPSDVFVPMIPAMVVGALGIVLLAGLFGLRERARVGVLELQNSDHHVEGVDGHENIRRPKLLWVNALLTVALMVALVKGLLPLPVLFMIAFAIAMVINYPDPQMQRKRIAAYADNILAVVSLIFAAGIFTGILSGTGMVEAMAQSFLAVLPPQLGPHMGVITALASMPFTFFMSNDAFYFGILPVIAKVAAEYGFSAAEIARASIVGQPVHLLSPLVASTYLLLGMVKIEFGDHQRFTLKWAALVCLLIMVAALLTGAFPLIGG
ncbi:CitMHS family transporter [Pseudogulbenkiania sp. MAI-1]|uniref:CitMHS family transporter n=1 Tax=Pseudogulbenkiania sp. MAI-1 TaxID=990370 RepID=UPI00045E980F|nr:CitMHS family transporter [Pseudogulbenkiania sp. MAI-1]